MGYQISEPGTNSRCFGYVVPIFCQVLANLLLISAKEKHSAVLNLVNLCYLISEVIHLICDTSLFPAAITTRDNPYQGTSLALKQLNARDENVFLSIPTPRSLFVSFALIASVLTRIPTKF